MSPEAQRIAIAEACGWAKCRLAIKGAGGGMRTPTAYGFPPERNYEAPCPDYCRDLNAMHEAEDHLDDCPENGDASEWAIYRSELRSVCEREEIDIIHSTAAQRAEAFLRTIGKWLPQPTDREVGK